MSTFYKIKKDGTKSWYYCFVYHGKKYRGVGGTTKTQALRAMEKVRAELIDGTFNITLHKPTHSTLNSFITEFLNIHQTHKKQPGEKRLLQCTSYLILGKRPDSIKLRQRM